MGVILTTYLSGMILQVGLRRKFPILSMDKTHLRNNGRMTLLENITHHEGVDVDFCLFKKWRDFPKIVMLLGCPAGT